MKAEAPPLVGGEDSLRRSKYPLYPCYGLIPHKQILFGASGLRARQQTMQLVILTGV